MVILSINSPSLSSPSSPLSSFKPSPLPSSPSQDPTELPSLSCSLSQINPETIIIHLNPRKPEQDRKEEQPKSTPLAATQIKGLGVVLKERGGMSSCSDVGDNKEREGKEGKKKKDGSSSLKKPKLKRDTQPEVGFRNPMFSHELKSLLLKAKGPAAPETEKKCKFSITMSTEEIEADFFAITLSEKMPKRRKRKPKTDTQPEVGFKNPMFSCELKSLGLKAKAAAVQEIEKKPKFSITMSTEEIETDFFAITQSEKMPTRRKRSNHKEIERLFPGSSLSEITPDTYRVKGFPGSRK